MPIFEVRQYGHKLQNGVENLFFLKNLGSEYLHEIERSFNILVLVFNVVMFLFIFSKKYIRPKIGGILNYVGRSRGRNNFRRP
jgi:uncharacterized membrane protein